MRRFLFEYPFDGGEYALEIPADDEAEAKARLKAIPWAKYKGEIFATIPANPFRWWRWWRT